jgi:hypothetical protein
MLVAMEIYTRLDTTSAELTMFDRVVDGLGFPCMLSYRLSLVNTILAYDTDLGRSIHGCILKEMIARHLHRSTISVDVTIHMSLSKTIYLVKTF